MDKKTTEWLKNLASEGHIRMVILGILSQVKNSKYVTSDYFGEFLKNTPNRDVRAALYDLASHGFLDRHSLIKYRHRQDTHDARIVRDNLDILIKRGILTEPQRKTYLVIPIKLIKDHTPPEVKREIGWQDDIEAHGRQQYDEFVKNHVVGPISQRMNINQSVFRINEKGCQKLAEFIDQFRLYKAELVLKQKT